MSSLKIRDAATLIIACAVKNPLITSHDYKIMLLKRSQKMSFAADFIVFPGGAHEQADTTRDWYEIIPKLDKLCLAASSPRPNRFKLPFDSKTTLPPEISFRICAIRETFEETGLLIANKRDNKSETNPKNFGTYMNLNDNLVEWRHKVKENPNEFLKMLDSLKLVPDLTSLHEWSNWLGPEIETKRFDTMFFTCFLGGIPSYLNVDTDEIAKLKFLTPEEAIEKYHANEIELKPPQLYELNRFLTWKKIEELADYSCKRQFTGGVTTWLPKFIKSDLQGIERIGLLPGDQLYDGISSGNCKNRVLMMKNKRFKIESNLLSSERH